MSMGMMTSSAPAPAVFLPLAAPISAVHQSLIAQQQISRASANSHQRARTAAAQTRSMGAAPHPTQFDPNAPSVPRTGAAAVATAAAAVSTARREIDVDHAKTGAPRRGSTTAAAAIAAADEAPPSWTILDIGGLSVRNLSASLFQYAFLTMLYLNHNVLLEIPPEIERLRSLVLLDVSGNRLITLPPEVGMLINLQCLYAFDNKLTSLPWELGNLYQLESLGIEGNPLPENVMLVSQKDGTQALIVYLREHAPSGSPPLEREWITIEKQPPTGPSETCSVFCYNILAERYATPKMYGYTPSWALDWRYRSDLILQEILSYSADIVCLQEVEMQVYETYFQPQLKELGGYDSVFWPKTRARTMSDWERKTVDGCATFFRAAKYQLVDQQHIEFNQMALQKPDFKNTEDVYNRLATKDNIAVLALLRNLETNTHLLVANCHIHWDPSYCDVKLVQVAMLMEQLELVCTKYSRELATLEGSVMGSGGASTGAAAATTAADGSAAGGAGKSAYQHPNSRSGLGAASSPSSAAAGQLPVFICGDFNSTPDSGVYELLRAGKVDKNHPDFLDYNYGNYTKDGLSHRMQLRSAYADSKVTYTNLVPNFVGVIDYIWFTHPALSVVGLLGGVDKSFTRKCVGFPNAHFPSDHIPLLAEFRICK
ncbi:Endonuclease/exonuclease/phosphatase [Blastocladiella britannica]|nr:Endonuclease/exonuclease/phosphatase [Blastocladiella britannica]